MFQIAARLSFPGKCPELRLHFIAKKKKPFGLSGFRTSDMKFSVNGMYYFTNSLSHLKNCCSVFEDPEMGSGAILGHA